MPTPHPTPPQPPALLCADWYCQSHCYRQWLSAQVSGAYQTHKRLKTTLFIYSDETRCVFLWYAPFSSYKTTLKEVKQWKMRCRMLICFWLSCVVLLWCLVLGRIQHWTPKQHSKTAQPKADKYHTSHFSLFSWHVCNSGTPSKDLLTPEHFYLSTYDQHTICFGSHVEPQSANTKSSSFKHNCFYPPSQIW